MRRTLIFTALFGWVGSSISAPVQKDQSDSIPETAYQAINISAPDDSIRASFIPLGARITHLWVKDRESQWRDIVLGFDYDNTSQYETNSVHPYFGALVGRYANRIKNSTFEIPPSNEIESGGDGAMKYNITANENDGIDTLHGGDPGYDRRAFEIEKHDNSSVIFTLDDPDGSQGFPGKVMTRAEYKLKNGAKWEISYKAKADAKTPIMYSSHTYFNLDAYKSSDGKEYDQSKALDHHHLQISADRIIDTDSILIPTGSISNVSDNVAYDFHQEHIVSERFDQTTDGCGANCTGYDNCFIFDRRGMMNGEDGNEDHDSDDDNSDENGNEDHDNDDDNDGKDDSNDEPEGPLTKRQNDDDDDDNETVLQLWSDVSGIKLSLQTNQDAVQIYTCNSLNDDASISRKSTQGDGIYDNHSCIVIEPESLIDGINNPEWGVDQIFGPNRDYEFEAQYTFTAQ